jgi:uncharacterized membrane protein
MSNLAHLWAVSYDDLSRAEQARETIKRLGWEKHYLILEDVAVVVRHPDGSFTLDCETFSTIGNILGSTVAGFLAGLVVAAPLTGAVTGAILGGIGSAAYTAEAGIPDAFVRDVEGMMKPGTATLFVLDAEGDMDVILAALRGLGGTVLQTNVDVERARLIQSTLSTVPAKTGKNGGGDLGTQGHKGWSTRSA